MGKTSDLSRWDINKFYVPGTCQVRYFSHAQMEADISRIEGTRPHLIVNVSEPFDELIRVQRVTSVLNDAQIINLY